MPRRHDRGRERPTPPRPRGPRSLAPDWAQTPGYTVRQVIEGQKEYRCPGCDQEVRAGTAHLVVMPDDQPDLRRHWHTPCWQREQRRSG